jgi:hypothetical protein
MAEFRAAWPKNGPVKFLPGREVCGLESGPAPNFLKGIVQPLKRGLMGGINSGTGRIWQPGASLHQDRRRSSEEASTPLPTPPPPPAPVSRRDPPLGHSPSSLLAWQCTRLSAHPQAVCVCGSVEMDSFIHQLQSMHHYYSLQCS